MPALVRLLLFALNILQILIIIHVILSWIRPRRHHPAMGLLDSIVSPILYPIRNVLRPYMRNMPIDFSPLVAILLLEVVRSLLIRLA
jgi:YggT family protein